MTHVNVLIIGSGFAGLGMAIRLEQEGRRDFLVLERFDDVGGTWFANTYPGAACDVPSRLYSFSFAPNPHWSRSFSPQNEILDYLRSCADRFGVRDRIRFGTSAEAAEWDEQARRWHVRTNAGDFTCDVLVSGAGALSAPKLPPVEGAEDFAGKVFHSAAWDHDHDVAGERVAVIGTGASSIQIVPQIQPKVASLKVFQRTPAWIIPRTDRPFTKPERWLYKKIPGLDKLARSVIYWGRESYVVGFAIQQRLMKLPELIARAHLKRHVPDPELRAKLTPSYTIGCKRILISNDFYPALAADNADVVTSPIARMTPEGIVTEDGVAHEVDTIVFATGFQVTPPPIAEGVRGRAGRRLVNVWSEHGMQAHRGTTINGFPNLFFLVGPNTGLGHTSMVYVIESQIEYVLRALEAMDREGIAAMEPTAAAQEAFNAALQRRLRGTVWDQGGCASWYLDDTGRNTTLWPWFTFRFRKALSEFDSASYEKVAASG
jgi:cation diffusion facilitator CzcD-associated flavoprotein CzcO